MPNKQTLAILITTMNEGIERVKRELLPQLQGVDEVIISHQITKKHISPETEKLGDKVKYVFLREKGLSKNRNNALHYAESDICHICDDDLNFISGFVHTIKETYKQTGADIITFQAENIEGKKHFHVKEGKHTRFSILRIWSWGITFQRKKLLEKRITFDENFGLGTDYSVGEENIFLTDCYKKGLQLYHSSKAIVIHPDESSGIEYKGREDLIIARMKVWKKTRGRFISFLALIYLTIFHYKYYKKVIGVRKFIRLSWKGLKK